MASKSCLRARDGHLLGILDKSAPERLQRKFARICRRWVAFFVVCVIIGLIMLDLKRKEEIKEEEKFRNKLKRKEETKNTGCCLIFIFLGIVALLLWLFSDSSPTEDNNNAQDSITSEEEKTDEVATVPSYQIIYSLSDKRYEDRKSVV